MSEQNMNTAEEQITVTLTMEDDEEIDCAVLTTYSANGREYIALLPLNEEGESEDGDEMCIRDSYTAVLSLSLQPLSSLMGLLLRSSSCNYNPVHPGYFLHSLHCVFLHRIQDP